MKQRIIITEKDHPHYGEMAEFIVSEEGTVQIYDFFGKSKLKVKLINCPHMVDECYVGRNGIKLI